MNDIICYCAHRNQQHYSAIFHLLKSWNAQDPGNIWHADLQGSIFSVRFRSGSLATLIRRTGSLSTIKPYEAILHLWLPCRGTIKTFRWTIPQAPMKGAFWITDTQHSVLRELDQPRYRPGNPILLITDNWNHPAEGMLSMCTAVIHKWSRI